MPLVASGLDDFAVLQATFAAAMFETFFKQLKLINTIMTTLPLAWSPADTDRERAPDMKAGTSERPAIDPASTSNVMGPEVLPARRKARKNKAAGGKIIS
ncbi:MAG: hypothetical protein ACLQIQ_18640 [Beijerinckiaceae bacterium]